MQEIPLAFVTIFLVVLGGSHAFIPPAGKCRADVTPVQIDINAMQICRHWYAVYFPDGKEFRSVDSDHKDIFSVVNNAAFGIHRIKMKNNSTSSYVFTYTYGSDNVIYEAITTDTGKTLVFKLYILYFIPDEIAFLYYRCSDTGSLDFDTRFTAMARGKSLSAAAEQQLLAKDASCNFTGGIQKLDNKLV